MMPYDSKSDLAKRFFISYSHMDEERITPYLNEMERQSIPYWYDKGLHAGRNFSNEIAWNINASDGFLLFLSQHAADSWYVFDELTFARNRRKKVVVIHLDRDIVLPEGMELLLGNLHQMFSFRQGMAECVTMLSETLYDDANRAEPVQFGMLNHNSDLLQHCRASFEHIARQMGVQNVEESIDPNLFCPIQSVQEKHVVELYSEICREDHTHILLHADGGLGKTYTFLYTMKRLLDCDRPCAYIPCHLFTGTGQDDLGLILSMLCLIYLPEQKHSEAKLNEYFRSQTDKAFILFLDGYNEAVVKHQLSAELVHLSSAFPSIKIVVSSRCSDPIFVHYAHYSMHGLSSDRVATILRGYNRSYEQLNFSLQKLLLTPMFLRLYLRMEHEENETDTAAELMDQERQRVLSIIRRNGMAALPEETVACLNRVFPDFVRLEYCTGNRRMSFPGKRLEDYLREHYGTTGVAERMFDFLVEYSMIMKCNDRTNSYAYQHEHYRDYWVAFSVFQELLRNIERDCSGAERANAMIDTLSSDYAQIVLRYVGELAQVNLRGNPLDHVLDSLRRDAVQDDALWADTSVAGITSKVIEIYKLVLEEDLVGIRLDGLNLANTRLNQTRTCTRSKKATFQGSLIAERTFVASMHESAPRRVEILRLEDKCYLVTISNQDLLISSLPELDTVWRYPHVDMQGRPVSTHSLTTSVMLGCCLLSVDTAGDVWEWNFHQKGGIPLASAVRCHRDAAPAIKVFPWADDDGALIGLQREDGTILQFAQAFQPDSDEESLGILSEELLVPELAHAETRKTLTSSPLHTFFCWAVARQDGIHVFKYDIRARISRELCIIPEPGLSPDYMICVGSEQSSRINNGLDFGASGQDGSMLILSAISTAVTRVYQIQLPQSNAAGAAYRLLEWADGKTELTNRYEKTQQPFNRINAVSLSKGKMVLAANDGKIYLFTYDAAQRCFVADAAAPWISIAKMTFAIEDVLFISEDTIAAVSVDRFVHLIDANSLFLKKKLRGYNDGLRSLLPVSDQSVMVTSYDGCILELVRDGERMICRDKLPIGAWCWSIEQITHSVYAVGYMSGLALADIANDTILSHIRGFEQKVEHLIYLADRDRQLIAISKTGARVYTVREQDGSMWLEDTGRLALPDRYACYWTQRSGNSLFLSLGDMNEDHPCIAHFDLTRPLLEQTPVIIETGAKYGRIRDIRVLNHHLMLSGWFGEKTNDKSSQVRFIDIADLEKPVPECAIEGLPTSVVHSAAFPLGERCWRLALIDSQSKGVLYQYTLEETDAGSLAVECVSTHSFQAILCDVAFDSHGDLLLTCLNGCLYEKLWLSEKVEQRFRNKSYMLTFGADMSSLYNPVDGNSRLGGVLADFGNRLVRSRREFRRSR